MSASTSPGPDAADPKKAAEKGSKKRGIKRGVSVTIIGGMLTFAGQNYLQGDPYVALGSLAIAALVFIGFHVAEERGRAKQYADLLDTIGLGTFKTIAEASDDAKRTIASMDPQDLDDLLGSGGSNSK